MIDEDVPGREARSSVGSECDKDPKWARVRHVGPELMHWHRGQSDRRSPAGYLRGRETVG
jgi:hypothetical protein